MALNTRDRSVLFVSMSKFADPEAVDAMLAHFPTRDVDEPLTSDSLDSRLIEFREELRFTLLTEFRAFDVTFGELRQEMDAKLGALRQDLEGKLRRSSQWTGATMLTVVTVRLPHGIGTPRGRLHRGDRRRGSGNRGETRRHGS